MSTQDESGIPFSLLPEDQHQHFRLLELPPELLDILISENGPTLRLKSSEGATREAGGTAVLCTPDKTYNIRQKNSSNTVYLLQSETGCQDVDKPAEPGLRAISQPKSTLETTPAVKPPVAAYIRQLLPVIASTGQTASGRENWTRAQLIASIPASDGECEAALRELAVFVQGEIGHCVLPSAQLKMQTWLSILESARAEAINITTSLSSDDICRLQDGSEYLPSGIFEAVLHATTIPSSDNLHDIYPDRLVRWVGMNRLELDASKSAISLSSFKRAWRDALPDDVREKADLAFIADRQVLSEGGKMIMFKDYALDLEIGVGGTGAAESKSALGMKRKWHEKFRPSKKGA